MALALGDNIQETATCTGTTGDILLAGNVAGFDEFADQHSAGDTVFYEMLQGAGPVTREWGKGIFQTGPNRIVRSGAGTAVYRSTNGGSAVNWGAGTINVLECGSGLQFLSLLAIGATGLMAQTADWTWVRRTLTGTAKLPVSQGDGVAGNPTLSQSWLDAHVLDRDPAAAEADRTMGGRVVLGAVATVFKGLATQLHKLYGDDGLTDQIGEWFRNGANDWRLRLNIGGALRRVLTANASDLNDADRLLGWDPTHTDSFDAANPGFIHFGTLLGGLTLNFGTTSVGNGATSDVNLPKAYATAHLVAIASQQVTAGGEDKNMEANALSLTQIRLRNHTSNTLTVHWLSIGY